MIKMNKHYHVQLTVFSTHFVLFFFQMCLCLCVWASCFGYYLVSFLFFDVFPFLLLLQNKYDLHSFGEKNTHILWRCNWVKERGVEKSQQRTEFRAYIQWIFTQAQMQWGWKNEERNAMRVKGREWTGERRTHARSHTYTHLHHTSWCEFNTEYLDKQNL